MDRRTRWNSISVRTNDLYAALPVFAQNLACSWAGYRRFRERYSPHFHEYLAGLTASGALPLEGLHEIQRERLIALVARARETVPYYRDLSPASTKADAREAIEETLCQIPVLEKSDYREHHEALVARDIAPGRLREGVTSGTTGSALHLYYTPDALAEEYATVWRMRASMGVGLRDPNMTFGGQIIVPFEQRGPPYWRWNAYGRQQLFSLYHMTAENLADYVDAIHASDAVYAAGYPSALHLVSRSILAAGRPLPRGRLKAVFTSSESLLAFHRETIEEAFGAPVRDRYGSSEFAASMTGCSEGNLHVDMEFGIVEVETQDETDEFVRGQILVTGFGNEATPFIRYRIGDVGSRLKRPCACGRAGDVFLDVDGRIEDFVMTPDGRLVGRLDHIFKNLTEIEEAQILQESKEAIRVLYVAGGGWGDDGEAKLMREIRSRLGDRIGVELVRVDTIPREPNGKFRAVKSNIGKLD